MCIKVNLIEIDSSGLTILIKWKIMEDSGFRIAHSRGFILVSDHSEAHETSNLLTHLVSVYANLVHGALLVAACVAAFVIGQLCHG